MFPNLGIVKSLFQFSFSPQFPEKLYQPAN